MARRTGQIIRRGDARFVVRIYLGTNINVTLGTYSHVLPTMQQEASDKLEKLLFG